ncbi:unnamed protein product [Trichobilharzia szidati]|nr:unnamed protein product [Trichobilharzia szidati]CAH8874841.1 unnamed protein product [Trichobilharzia szidati]
MQIKQQTDHFKRLLSPTSPITRREIRHTTTEMSVNTNLSTKADDSSVIKLLEGGGKSGRTTRNYPGSTENGPRDLSHHPHAIITASLEGKVPTDWKKGYIVRLPKKGDMGLCNN